MPQSPDRSYRTQGERALWVAVVQQAIDDLNTDRDSLERADAVAFFTGTGEWRQSRIDIADKTGIHADDLERCGRRIMQTRGITEAVPIRVAPMPVAVPTVAPLAPLAPLPELVATFNPEVVKLKRGRQRPTRDRHWWIAQFMAGQAA